MKSIYLVVLNNRWLAALTFACILILTGCSSEKSTEPAMRIDLLQYGLMQDAHGKQMTSRCYIGFISNELVFVSVNQRLWNSAVEPSNIDTPSSKILIFDTKRKALLKSGEMRIEKDYDSIQAITNQRFVIRNESGIQICDMDLVCGNPISVPPGPLVASPAGTSFLIGGYGGTEQLLFDANSFSLERNFARSGGVAIPGDGAILLHDERHKLSIEQYGKPTSTLPITDKTVGEIFLPSARFLGNSVVGVSDSRESLAVATTKGAILYRVPVNSWYEGTTLFTSSAGERFGIFESSHTLWNSVTHFYDIKESRPYDLERIRVLESKTGKSVIEIVNDPRPYIPALTIPALSSDGHLFATIRKGVLEVYNLD